MKILSFDIGIKNLSFCILEYDLETKNKKIIEWDIINLLETEIEEQVRCTHIGRKKCEKFADFCTKNKENYYCKTHKTKNEKNHPLQITNFKTNNICSYEKCKKQTEFMVNGKMVCKTHRNKEEKIFKSNYRLIKIKRISCKDFDINTLLEKIVKIFDEKYIHFLQCDLVLLELQASTIAPKMKTISNVLYSYFLIRGKIDRINNSNIKQISNVVATNKLKYFDENTEENIDTYKHRKRTGIDNVISYLKITNDEENMIKFKSHKKKDDLSDALLQALYWITFKIEKN
jgi:hypothetical protein